MPPRKSISKKAAAEASPSKSASASPTSSTKASPGKEVSGDEQVVSNVLKCTEREQSPTPKKRNVPEPSIEQEPVTKKAKQDEAPSTPEQSKEGPTAERFPSPHEEPVTELDKQTWQGWCEIESDPAYFSVILREMGVKNVTVREVFEMDPEYIKATVPQPLHALILLFRHRPVETENQEKDCPAHIWFANQMPAQNSCATLAMTQAVLNNPLLDIGEHLNQFKLFTQDMTPYQRGEAFASFDFVKKIHNSFAKKMDLLENDKHLAHKVRRAQKHGHRRIDDSPSSDDSSASLEDNAHHFIAFVPVDGEVWKLDGMDAQPTKMGSYKAEEPEEWVNAIAPKLNTIMSAGDADYSVVALAQSPLAARRKDLCLAVNTNKLVESRLNALDPDWEGFLFNDDGSAPPEPLSPTFLNSLGIEEKNVDAAVVPEEVKAEIEREEMPDLITRRSQLCGEQLQLQNQILDGMGEEAAEDAKAEQRRFDYGPVVKRWLEMLAENGYLEQNLHRFMK
ncbi:cysteine proteinase [Corynespora cassiicola Philippines]|uniref:Ubiquitin carboxyl-terminal hydrolase n=1 Tax=Corynespora cassiicola Philippines TaxID=1448308 RepID=A0A2T2NAN7_CORCC|nr:cysteine proteinase [Corynespora cassiicola Philippines]